MTSLGVVPATLELIGDAARPTAQVSVLRPTAHRATGPEQVWSWDITYLQSPVRGLFWYLYLVMDIWSRRIMGWAVHPTQCDAHAASLFTTVCREHAVTAAGLVLHADNGGPMKGATMLATKVLPGLSAPALRDPRCGAHLGRGLRDVVQPRPSPQRDPVCHAR